MVVVMTCKTYKTPSFVNLVLNFFGFKCNPRIVWCSSGISICPPLSRFQISPSSTSTGQGKWVDPNLTVQFIRSFTVEYFLCFVMNINEIESLFTWFSFADARKFICGISATLPRARHVTAFLTKRLGTRLSSIQYEHEYKQERIIICRSCVRILSN